LKSLEENFKKNKVSCVSVIKVKGGDIYRGVSFAIERVGGVNLKGKSVLIKPNLVDPRLPESGEITNPEVVEALIKYCKEKGAEKIVVGDGPSYYQSETRLKDCFTKTGTAKVAEKCGVKWVIFDDLSYRKFRNVSPYTPPEFMVTDLVFTSDVIINVPVMKTHFMSKVTLAMKNLKGTLKRENKPKFHRNLARAVVELNKIVRPTLNIVDATLVRKDFPLLIAGKDIVATDAVTSSIMGFNPEDVEMIKFGFEEGLGEINLDKIKVEGDDLKGIKMNFFLPSEKIKEKFPLLKLEVENACCGCLIPILSCLSEFEESKEKLKIKLRIVAGEKEEKILKTPFPNTVFIGNCTKKVAKNFFVEGCPPDEKEIKKTLKNFFIREEQTQDKKRGIII